MESLLDCPLLCLLPVNADGKASRVGVDRSDLVLPVRQVIEAPGFQLHLPLEIRRNIVGRIDCELSGPQHSFTHQVQAFDIRHRKDRRADSVGLLPGPHVSPHMVGEKVES